MIRMMVAAPTSGSGKTVVTCALLRALKNRGLNPCAFKCGPDYIDPMFHRLTLGMESHNLDLFLSDEAHMKSLYDSACAGHGAAICEGVMGYYDGLGGTSDRASAWHIADTLAMPVLLVLHTKGASLTLAAQIKGLCQFRENSHIAGVILNECPPALCRTLAPMLEKETGVPVLGCLPRMDEAKIESRHLGLYTASEYVDMEERLDALARALEENVDVDRLLSLYRCDDVPPAEKRQTKQSSVRIAVAWDEAFCFAYAETFRTLEEQGAELVCFSPMCDAGLPKGVCGLYLPGGYPELHARELFENRPMRNILASAITEGLPTVAECGGFLYLGAALRDPNGTSWPMVGALSGEAANAGKLARFGYVNLMPENDSLLFRSGEHIPAHEFHHWDSTENGDALRVEKPLSDRAWRECFVSSTLYAGFPHLYFAGHPQLAKRFVTAAKRYGERNGLM